MQTNFRRGLLLIVGLGFVLSAQGQVVFVWDGSSSTAWGTGANWDPLNVGPAPSSGDIARFNANTANDPTIAGNATAIGSLEFLAGTDAETIAGSATLTINGVAGAGITNSSDTAVVISPKVALGGSQTWATSMSVTASNLTLNATINLGAHTLTIDSGASTTVAVSTGNGDVISGSGGSIVKDGTGTLTFGNVANTFTGGVTLNAGTLQVGNAGSLGTGTLTLAGGTLTSTADRTLTNALALSGSSTIAGANGIDYIFSSNTVSGSAGTLSLGNITGSGLMTLGFSGNGFDFARPIDAPAFTELRFLNTSGIQTFSDVISGAGTVRQSGAGGTVILAGSNTYTGATTIAAGTLKLGATGDATNTPLGTTAAGTTVSATGAALDLNGFTLGTAEALTINGTGVGSTGALTNSGGASSYHGVVTLGSASTIGGAGDITLSAGLAGNFTLTKAGAGTLTLDAASSRTAATNVTGGVLQIGDVAALGTGALDVGAGTLTSTVSGTLTNNLNLSSATAKIQNADGIDLIFSSNTITGSAGSVLNLVNGTGSGTTSVGFSGTALTYNRGVSVGANTELRFTNTSGTQTFSGAITGSGTLVRSGPGGTTTISAANTSFGGTTLVSGGTLIAGNDAALGTTNLINLAGGTLSSAADRIFANSLTLSASSTIAGANGIDFTFSSNTVGGTAGTLTLSNTTGSGLMTAGFSGNGFDFARPVAVGAFTELRLLNTSGTQTFSNTLTGTGLVRRNGSGGTTILSADNSSFAGSFSVDAGTLALGHDAALGGATLTLNGGTIAASGGARSLTNAVALILGSTIGGTDNLTFSGGFGQSTGSLTLAVTNTGLTTFNTLPFVLAENSQTRVLTIDVAGTSGGLVIDSAVQAGTGTGADGLTKLGAGKLTLNGANTYTGTTTLTAGTLEVGSNSALGTGAFSFGAGTLTATADRALANNLTITAATSTLSGADGVNFTFSGTLAGSGAGKLNLVNTTGSGLMSAAFSNATFTYANQVDLGAFTELRSTNTSGTQTFSGTLTGSGNLVRSAVGGTTTISGSNTSFSGNTLLSGGTLVVGNNAAFGTGTLTLAGGTLNATADRTLANNLTLSGDTTISGPSGVDFVFSSNTISTTGGTLSLDNTSTGLMSVGFSGTGFDFTRPIAFTDALSELRFLNTSGTQTFSGVISGGGSLLQNGAGGTVVLSGTNTAYTGVTTLTAGTLQVGDDSALGTGTLTLNGGTLTATADRTLANNLNVTAATGGISAANGIDFVFSGTLTGTAGNQLDLVNSSGAGVMSVAFNNPALNYNRGLDLGAFTELRLSNTSGAQTLSGLVTGSGTLVRSGVGGTTTISGNNAGFTGATVLSGGTLVAGHDAAFGTGTLNLAGGTLNAAADRAISTGLTLSASSTISGAAGIDFIFSSNAVSATGGTLSLANTSGSGLMSVGFSGSGFDFAQPIDAAAFTELRFLNAAGTQTFSNVISGAGTVVQNGAGGTVLLSGNNTYTGATTVTAGTLKLGAVGALGTAAGGTTVGSGATLDVNGNSVATAEALTLSGTGVSAGGALTNSGAAASYAGVVTLAASTTIGGAGDLALTQGLTGNFTLTKNGAGTLGLDGASTRNADTQIDAGTLRLGNATAAGLATRTLTLNGGTLDLAIDSSVSAYATVVSASSTILSDKATPGSAGIAHTLGTLNLNNASTLHVAAGGNVGSGTAGLAFGATTLGVTGATFDVASGASLTLASIAGNTRSFTATGAGDMTVTGAITTTTGGIAKSGTGTLTLAGTDTYSGATTISQGVVSVQNNAALGAVGGSTTVAASGAALELSNVAHGNLTTSAEPLFLNGTGIGGNGALRNVAGTNTYAGLVTVSSPSLIAADTGSALTLGGGVTATNQALTLGTTANDGNITVSGNVGLGTGTLTKDGAGMLTLSGTTSTVGHVALDAGTLSVGGTSTLTASLGLDAAAGTTLSIATGGTVSATYAAGTTTTFSGAMTGGGTFQMNGAASNAVLVLDSATGFTAASLSLTLNGGTLRLTGGGDFVFGTIHITGNTILDFDNSAGTVLSSGALVIDPGVAVTVANWIGVSNTWYVTNVVNGSPLGGVDQVGGTPLGQVGFNDHYAEPATWVSGNHDGFFDHEIRPTPEPATYGALLLSATLGLLAWRRAKNRATTQT